MMNRTVCRPGWSLFPKLLRHFYLGSASGMLALSLSTAAFAADKMLVLKTQGELFGPASIRMSPLGLRVRTKIGESLWLKSKPEYFYMINPENKTYLEMTRQAYIDDLREDYPALRFERKEVKREGSLFNKPRQTTVLYRKDEGAELKSAEVESIARDMLPADVCRVWSELITYQPEPAQLPLACKQLIKRGWMTNIMQHVDGSVKGRGNKRHHSHWMEMLTTNDLQWQNCDPSIFKLPAGYKRAVDRASLYLSTDGEIKKGDIEEFFMRELK